MPTALDKVQFRGVIVNRATRAAILYMEEYLLPPDFPKIELAQGSYNTGVQASAGTHDRGGVVDFRVANLSAKEAAMQLKAAKQVGFAIWARDARDGMDPHQHGCIYGDGGQDMAWLARQQRLDYDKGLNGLKGHAKDRNSWRPNPKIKWSWKLDRPVRR